MSTKNQNPGVTSEEAKTRGVTPPINVELHQKLCTEIHDLYIRKNHDYGDSFHLLFEEEGFAACRIRLGDKLNRIKVLSKTGAEQMVADENLRDTFIDLANYAMMAVIEMDRQKLAHDNV